jgi:hypothetical protein
LFSIYVDSDIAIRGKRHGDEDVSPGLLNEFNRPEGEGSSREI